MRSPWAVHVDLLVFLLALVVAPSIATELLASHDFITSTERGTAVSFDLSGSVDDPDSVWFGKPPTSSPLYPRYGSIVQRGSLFTYTPAPGFIGVDSFTYTVTDALGACATSRVFVTVTPPPALEAGNQTVEACQQTATTFNVSTSVSSVGDPFVNAPQPGTPSYPQHGTLSKSGLVFTYQSDDGYVGLDSFQYVVTDSLERASVGHITVNVISCIPPTTGTTGTTGTTSTGTTSTGTTGTTSTGTTGTTGTTSTGTTGTTSTGTTSTGTTGTTSTGTTSTGTTGTTSTGTTSTGTTGTTSTGTTSTGTTGTTAAPIGYSGVSYARYLFQTTSGTASWTSNYSVPGTGFPTSSIPYAVGMVDDRTCHGRDGRVARALIPAGGTSRALHAQRFGGVVTGQASVVTGIKFMFIRAATGNGIRDLSARLVIDGVAVGTNLYELPNQQPVTWPTPPFKKGEIGGPGVMWGVSSAVLTRAAVNAPTFGLQLIVENVGGGPFEAQIDEIDVAVYWSTPSPAAMLDEGATMQTDDTASVDPTTMVVGGVPMTVVIGVGGAVALAAVAAGVAVVVRRRRLNGSGVVPKTKMSAKISPGGALPAPKSAPTAPTRESDELDSIELEAVPAPRPAGQRPVDTLNAVRAAVAARIAATHAPSPEHAQSAELRQDE